MMQFSSLKLLYHVKWIWTSMFIRANDVAEATPTPVEAGMNLKEAVLSLQAQVDEILEIIGS